MLISYVGDIHLSVKLGQRTESYPYDILNKLKWVYEESKRRGVDAILQGGDVFHLKSQLKNPHWLVQAAHEALGAGDIPVIITPGNHDLNPPNRVDSLPQQPLGSLLRMRGFTAAIGPVDGVPVYGIPYMLEEDMPKMLPREMRKVETWRKKNKYNSIIIISHLTVFPHDKPPIYDWLDANDYAELVANKEVVTTIFNGHIHEAHNAYRPLGPQSLIQIVNPGSLSRGSLTGENLRKEPQVVFYDTDTEDLEFVTVPHKPADQVFKLDSAGAVKERKASMTNFLDSLQPGAVEITDSRQVIEEAKKQGLSSTTIDTLETLLEWVE